LAPQIIILGSKKENFDLGSKFAAKNHPGLKKRKIDLGSKVDAHAGPGFFGGTTTINL